MSVRTRWRGMRMLPRSKSAGDSTGPDVDAGARVRERSEVTRAPRRPCQMEPRRAGPTAYTARVATSRDDAAAGPIAAVRLVSALVQRHARVHA
jgi:hypothetical protein